MKFVFGYPFFTAPANPSFLTPTAIGDLAAAAEAASFEAAFFSEHPAPPNNWRESGGHDALDPFVALSFAAAATQDLKLLTNLTVVPYRNPFMLAKTAATLDVLSGGRLILGMGAGYLKAEYFALGVDFEERNELLEEAIEVLKLAWNSEAGDGSEGSASVNGAPVNYEGRHFSAKDIVARPHPIQKPHPPFWLGGNSKLTRRRVASWGQGWMPMPNPKKLASRRRSAHLETNADLKEMIAYMQNHAETTGRTDPIHIMYMSFEGGIPGAANFELSKHLDSLAELAELGVSHIAVGAAGSDPNQVMEQINFVAQEIMPACKDL